MKASVIRMNGRRCNSTLQSHLRKISQSVTHDIVISGGGMVGAAMACALAKEPTLKGMSILLLESSTKTSLPPNFTTQPYRNRVSALSSSTKALLARIGAWDKMVARRTWPVKHMQVWEACSDAMISFDKPAEGEDLAYIVENDVTVGSLCELLDELGAHVETRYGVACAGYSCPDATDGGHQPFVNVHLRNGETLTTRLLIGADGHKSLVRRNFKMADISWDYKQAGVVATLRLSSGSDEITNFVAWQRFLPSGPIALLPLSPTQSSLTWTTSTVEAARLLALPTDEFVDAVNAALWDGSRKNALAETLSNALGEVLGAALAGPQSAVAAGGWQLPPTVLAADEGSRASFPLGLMHATNYVKPRVALVGDAAHRIHPLAGQGVNLGFGDVSCLAKAIAHAVAVGSDVGALAHLQNYESERQRHVLPTLATMDGLNQLYGTTFTPVVIARTLGLMATNSFQPLKAYMRSHAAS